MNDIHFFDEYVLRTPLLPINIYLSFFNNYSFENLIEVVNREPVIKDALYLASPEFSKQLNYYLDVPEKFSESKKQRLEITLLKYISRMATRCTPFGLFAGCSVGKFSNQNSIVLGNYQNHNIDIQLDTKFFTSLLESLDTLPALRQQLKYKPNDTVYVIGNYLRYIYYTYEKERRVHSIINVTLNETLLKILNKANNGLFIKDLVVLIATDETEYSEAEEYINQLIDHQILVSDFHVSLTSKTDFEDILNKLERAKLNELHKMVTEIKKIVATQHTIKDINWESLYKKILKISKTVALPFNEKYIIQADTYFNFKSNTLKNKIGYKVKRAIIFLEKFSDDSTVNNLELFKRAFTKKYETRELPLALILDPEMGIGYPKPDIKAIDSHPTLDRFNFKVIKNVKTNSWVEKDFYLQGKMKEAMQSGNYIIDISDYETIENNMKTKSLNTLSAMVEVLSFGGKEQIVLDSISNISATKLLGRFTNGNKSIYNHTKDIINKEEHIHKNKVLAEIVHTPESRTGNVIRRNMLRAYEIPYLMQKDTKANQIYIDDLMVSIKNDKVFIRSKSLNKIVIPCLSNAHNYTKNALPIYRFLCDLQRQNIKVVNSFNWGRLLDFYDYFPRVVFDSVILKKQMWVINKSLFESFTFSEGYKEWITQHEVPKFVKLINGDNTLLLNTDNETCFMILQKAARKNKRVFIEENLFDGNSIVKDEYDNNYANQFIISYNAVS